MIEISYLEDLPLSARAAIEAAQDRVQRAVSADNVEGIIGASKELIETVAKAVIDVLGGSYGSEVGLPKLAGQTLEAFKMHPTTLQGRGPLRQLSQSLISVAQAVAELRNMDGTGHGRSARTNLDKTHALLIRDVASVWCGWVLATSRRAGRAPHPPPPHQSSPSRLPDSCPFTSIFPTAHRAASCAPREPMSTSRRTARTLRSRFAGAGRSTARAGPSGRVRLEADQLEKAHDLIAPCLAPADSCLLEITGRDQQSKTDQQMSFRNR